MFSFLLAQAVPVPPKPVEIDFDRVVVSATADGPSLKPVNGGRPPAHFSSAVKLRTDFKQEIAESANEVR